MPRVHHVQKARKNHGSIKKGESYYWWKFRHGGKRTSKTRPRPSQLTQSDKKSQLYAIREGLEDAGGMDKDELESAMDTAASDLRTLGEEWQESADNMPDSLQDGEQYSRMEELAQNHETAADEVDSAKDEIEDEPDRDDYEKGDDGDDEHNTAVTDWQSDLDDKKSAALDAFDNNELEF